jgi:hypothetical protein
LFKSPLKLLRQSIWLSEVPDNISVPAIGGEPASVIPIEKATLDEVAFAELAISREVSALSRVSSSLSEIVKLARKQGARGVDNAVAAAVRELGERK